MARAITKKSPTSFFAVFGTPVVTLLLIALLGLLTLPWIIQALIQGHLAKVSDLPVAIADLDFSLFRSQFSIKGLQFSNPDGFPDGILAQIPKTSVHYSRRSLLRGKVNLTKIVSDFSEFRLIRNEKGDLNLPKVAPASDNAEIIEEVILNLGPVTYTDLTEGQPIQQTFDVGLANSVYRNVKGVSGIIEILTWEVLKRTGVQEKKGPVTMEITPIAESQVAGQTSLEPASSIPHEPTPSPLPPSPAPSAPVADEPS